MTCKIYGGIYVDTSLETEDCEWFCKLKYNIEEMKKTIGVPSESNCGSSIEWKIKYKGNVYSIYDWEDDLEQYLHLGFISGTIDECKCLRDEIENMINDESELSDIVINFEDLD